MARVRSPGLEDAIRARPSAVWHPWSEAWDSGKLRPPPAGEWMTDKQPLSLMSANCGNG